MDKSVKVEIAERSGNCEIITLAFSLDLTGRQRGEGGDSERERSVAIGNGRFTQLHNTAAVTERGKQRDSES